MAAPAIALEVVNNCIRQLPFRVDNTSENIHLVTLNGGWSLYKTSHRLFQRQAKSDPGSEGLESTLLDLQSFHDHVFLNTHARSSLQQAAAQGMGWTVRRRVVGTLLATAAVLQHAGSCMAI
jgi:hypothetical protein